MPSSSDTPPGSRCPEFYDHPSSHNYKDRLIGPCPVVHSEHVNNVASYNNLPLPSNALEAPQRPPATLFGAQEPNHLHYYAPSPEHDPIRSREGSVALGQT